ncbi:uncharacterized protein LOC111133020 isoform X3 [Crassostrea virginica]
MNQIECCLVFVLVFFIFIHSKEEREPIEPLCYGPGKTEKRCCVGYRTVAGKCHNFEDKRDNGQFSMIIVGILCGVIILLIVVLIAVISYKRKLPPSRPYQQELITTDGVSLAYASVENSPYLECNLTENTEISKDNPNHNQIEENKTTETGS